MGECFFWYRPTRVVPDQRPLNGRCCCCYLLNLSCQTGRQLGSFYSANSKEGLLYRGAITLRLCCVLHHSSNLTVVHWSLAWRASIDSMFLWIRTTTHVRSTDSTCCCCIQHNTGNSDLQETVHVVVVYTGNSDIKETVHIVVVYDTTLATVTFRQQ